MSFFDKFPEFVELDTRKDRGWSPVNAETLDNRHEVSLPEKIVKDCTVLDLGSCLGATGQWVLSHGCKHYTGVEIQPKMVETSNNLLSKYWKNDQFTIVKQDVREFLKQSILENKKWDVVVAVGIIYAFLDTYGILKEITEVTGKIVVIDSIYPNWLSTSPIIDVIRGQHINSEDEQTAFSGAGTRPNPEALKILMESLKFISTEGLLYPQPLTDKSVHDSYNTLIDRPWASANKNLRLPARYMLRFSRTEKTNVIEVGKLLAENNNESKVAMAPKPDFKINDTWEFDQSVADRFQQEAEQHIPDYQRVIEMCFSLTKIAFSDNKDINIIDVGSALGHTMNKFIKSDYKNVWGVDSSQAMVNTSKYPDRVILSKSFPTEKKWDVVLANWTLHFINEREEYLRDIYNSMNTNGVLILTDKMDHHSEIERMYYNFKRKNGVSDEVIYKKKDSLQGVLVTKPLEWYLDILKSLNFSRIQVINTRFMFTTIYARKL
jgi:SAM-dependent methyltransferase